ncbi:MAG TPA: hypothetical protein VF459_11075 [Caulobacteraceae bacterium]
MACCALAAFLIGQIIFGLDWARERLGLGAPPAPTPSAVVGWRLGASAAPHRPLDRRFSRRVGLAAFGAGAAFVVLAGATLALRPAMPTLDLGPICTALGLQQAASSSVR